MGFYSRIRPLLFALPPETAHFLALAALRAGILPPPPPPHPMLSTRIGALALPNPVGLAAGFDKNARCVDGCLRAGFGFVEIGTVTPRPQAGNPAPRLFRLVAQEAVINRMGFNNDGAAAAAASLAQRRQRGIVGGNIGKNKETEDALTDYVAALLTLYPQVDYLTANISSPNTPGLRNLQQAEALRQLLRGLHAARAGLVAQGHPLKPIWLKIAPDNDAEALAAIAEVALQEKLDAMIISNTTLDRGGVEGHTHAQEAGGLSGKPLWQKSTAVLHTMYRLTGGALPLIGVGGITTAEDAYAKIRAGASAVQLYTALVYHGLGRIADIQRGLAQLLQRDGYTTLQEAVGAAHRA